MQLISNHSVKSHKLEFFTFFTDMEHKNPPTSYFSYQSNIYILKPKKNPSNYVYDKYQI
jgi:hypothetical protein